MHAVDIKRFTVTRIGMAALAIGTLSAGIIGYVALNDATSDSSAVVASPNFERVPQADTIRFLELNTQLPSAVAAPALRSEEIMFMEMNTNLPAEAAPKVLSTAEILFLELNTQLPDSDALVPPAPGESQPVGGVTRY